MTLVDVDKKGFYLGNLIPGNEKCTSTFARKIREIRDLRSYALLTAFIIHVYYGCIWCISRGVLLRIFGGGVPPRSPNPCPISYQRMSFFTPVFRPGL